MIQGLAIGIGVAGLLLAAWTGIQAGRRRPTTEAQMVGAIVLEAALLVQAVIVVVRMVGGAELVEPVTFVAYSFGILLPLPLGFYLAREERTRWGSLSLCFTAVVVAVMTLRLMQLWQAGRV
jgi:drug/metabolite transporter (DMT)-like permease